MLILSIWGEMVVTLEHSFCIFLESPCKTEQLDRKTIIQGQHFQQS